MFPTEIADGTWGANGRINTLADIVTYVTGDPEVGRKHAERRLAARRPPPSPADRGAAQPGPIMAQCGR